MSNAVWKLECSGAINRIPRKFPSQCSEEESDEDYRRHDDRVGRQELTNDGLVDDGLGHRRRHNVHGTTYLRALVLFGQNRKNVIWCFVFVFLKQIFQDSIQHMQVPLDVLLLCYMCVSNVHAKQ